MLTALHMNIQRTFVHCSCALRQPSRGERLAALPCPEQFPAGPRRTRAAPAPATQALGEAQRPRPAASILSRAAGPSIRFLPSQVFAQSPCELLSLIGPMRRAVRPVTFRAVAPRPAAAPASSAPGPSTGTPHQARQSHPAAPRSLYRSYYHREP